MDVSNRINIKGDNTVEDSFTGFNNTVTQLSTSSGNVRMEQSISVDGKNTVSSSFNSGSAAGLAQAESGAPKAEYKSNAGATAGLAQAESSPPNPESKSNAGATAGLAQAESSPAKQQYKSYEPIKLINEDYCIRGQLLIERLRHILDKPLCVITVSGATVQPKKKLVNLFWQHLKESELSGNATVVSEKQNIQAAEMKKAGLTTRGLVMWGPFMHKPADGEEVAVVLLETGLPTRFDKVKDVIKKSFSLTLGSLLSSVHYLALQQSNENDPATVKGLDDFHRGNPAPHLGYKLFQEVFYVLSNVEGIKSQMGPTTMQAATSSVYPVLKEVFKKMDGCVLPPQQDIIDTKLSEIVRERLKPENLTIKQYMGRQLTGQDIIQFFQHYIGGIKIIAPRQFQMQRAHNAPNYTGTTAIEGVSIASSNTITDSTVSSAFNTTGSGMASLYNVLKDVNIQQSSVIENATVTNAMNNSGGSGGGGLASIHMENVTISANSHMSGNITGIPSDDPQYTQLQDSRMMSAMHQSDHISLRFPPAQLSLDVNRQNCTIYLNSMETGDSPVQGSEITTCINLPKAEYETKIDRQNLSITAKDLISGSQFVYNQSPDKVGSIFKIVVALEQKKQALVEVDASDFNLVVKVDDRILFSCKSIQQDDVFMQLPGGDYMMIFNHSEFSLLVENELHPQVPLFLYYKEHVVLQIPDTKLQLALNFKLFRIALTDITQMVGVDSEIDEMMKSVRNERSSPSKTALRAQDGTDYEIRINHSKAALIVRDIQEAKRTRFDYNWEQHTRDAFERTSEVLLGMETGQENVSMVEQSTPAFSVSASSDSADDLILSSHNERSHPSITLLSAQDTESTNAKFQTPMPIIQNLKTEHKPQIPKPEITKAKPETPNPKAPRPNRERRTPSPDYEKT